jgi:hypothetical protein
MAPTGSISRRRLSSSSSSSRIRQEPPCWVLHADQKNDNNQKAQKQKGVYVRPSGAIERGSGFFVPGLEGPRVRLVFGGVLLIFSVINHVANGALPTLSLEEIIAVVYSGLVLLQAVIEFRKEEESGLVVESGNNNNGNTNKKESTKTSSSSSSLREDFTQQWLSTTTVDTPSQDWKSRVEWAAASYLALTPATHMMLLEPGALVYRLGITSTSSSSSAETGANAALQALNKSTSGRIALPATHPVVVALVPDTHNRAVVLQRIMGPTGDNGDGDRCWLMASDQLLASFTQQELKWLGQLAKYVEE